MLLRVSLPNNKIYTGNYIYNAQLSSHQVEYDIPASQSVPTVEEISTTGATDLKEYELELLKIYTRLLGRMNFSVSAAIKVFQDFKDIAALTSSLFKSNIGNTCRLFPEEITKQISACLASTEEKILKAQANLSSEHKLKSVLEKEDLLTLPEKKIFGEEQVQVGTSLKIQKKEVTIMPMKVDIKRFLSRPRVIDAILENQDNLEKNGSSINHFLTASRWKTIIKLFKGKTVIPIFIYNDDYGPDDGLSPHSKSNKVSGYYYKFPTLPESIASRLDCIFVAMLAKTIDIKSAGANKLLQILVDELKPLEDRGVQIGQKNIYITPVILVGDNMALNLNLGIHGHSGNYFCRFCYMPKADTGTSCVEDPHLIRTHEHYLMCINEINNRGNVYGILFETQLNKLRSFHFSSSLVADIMHDLFSGIFVYSLIELLKKAIESKKFTLVAFNKAKRDFDYGQRDKAYVIEDITPNHLKHCTIRSHAREIWTLIKYLPAIISKLLNANCPLRKFAGMMSDLLDICLKTSFTEGDLQDMQAKATSFNREFLRLFNTSENRRNLPPKAHYLLHYSRVVRSSGPLKYLWSMRFESKHQECKSYAKVCHSRRNICLSLAKKICYNNAHNLLNNEDLLINVTETKFKKVVQLKLASDDFKSFESCISSKFKGTSYTLGDFILSKCLRYAHKILEIGVNKTKDELMLVVGTYNIIYNTSTRLYKLAENCHVNSSKLITDFAYPPISINKFDGGFYLRYSEF